jgi:hypothetical protein
MSGDIVLLMCKYFPSFLGSASSVIRPSGLRPRGIPRSADFNQHLRIPRSQVYLQQNKEKAEGKGKKCHAKTMWSLEKPI